MTKKQRYSISLSKQGVRRLNQFKKMYGTDSTSLCFEIILSDFVSRIGYFNGLDDEVLSDLLKNGSVPFSPFSVSGSDSDSNEVH